MRGHKLIWTEWILTMSHVVFKSANKLILLLPPCFKFCSQTNAQGSWGILWVRYLALKLTFPSPTEYRIPSSPETLMGLTLAFSPRTNTPASAAKSNRSLYLQPYKAFFLIYTTPCISWILPILQAKGRTTNACPLTSLHPPSPFDNTVRRFFLTGRGS